MLKAIPVSADLVAATVNEIVSDKEKIDYSETAVIFPSKRFQIFLLDAMAKKIARNFFPPRLFTIDRLVQETYLLNFPGHAPMTEIEQAFQIYRAAQQVFKDSCYAGQEALYRGFPEFFPWALRLLETLEDVLCESRTIESVSPERFETFAQLGNYHQSYKEFICRLPELIAVLSRQCQKAKRATRGQMYRQVAQLAQAGTIRLSPHQKWIFSGFNALGFAESQLLQYIFNHCPAVLVLRCDSAALDDPASPFWQQQETLNALKLPQPPAPDRQPHWNNFSDTVVIHPTANVETEMVCIHEVLNDLIKVKSQSDLKRIGIVLNDPASLIPFVQGVISRFDLNNENIPFNITLGYPFERTPLYLLIDSILTVGEHQNQNRFLATDYLTLIRHPYAKLSSIDGGDDEPLKQGIHHIESIIQENNLIHVSCRDTEERLLKRLESLAVESDLRNRVISEIQHLHAGLIMGNDLSFLEQIAFLKRAIDRIGKSQGGNRYLFLNEYVCAAIEALIELEKFSQERKKEFERSGMAATAAFIRRWLLKKTISFEGSPMKGVQVMGMLEYRGLPFDQILVADCNEGILPQTHKYDPLLPADIRDVLGMRGYREREQLFALNFFSLIGNAKLAHLFYTEKMARGEKAERSRFIERIVYEIEKKSGTDSNILTHSLPFSLWPGKNRRVAKDDVVRQQLSGLSLSPSSLETYIRCPLKFYYTRILGLKEREALATEADAGTFGSIGHQALLTLYRDFLPRAKGIKPDPNEVQKAIRQAYLGRNLDPEKGIEKIHAWIMAEKMRQYVNADFQRIFEKHIQIVGLETDLSTLIHLEELKDPVKIQGRIDRLEQEAQIMRIIDYKFGNPFSVGISPQKLVDLNGLCQKDETAYLKLLSEFSSRCKSFQILLYCLMLTQQTSLTIANLDASYVFLRKTEEKPVFVKSRGQLLDDQEKKAVLANISHNLTEIIKDLYVRKHFVANRNDERFCSRCEFRIACGNP